MPKSMLPTLQAISIACALLLLSGCSHFKFGAEDPVPECVQPPKVASKLENLLSLANDMNKMPAAARTVFCHNLVKRQQESPSQELLLQQAVGRTLSDACGDISKLLDQTNALTPSLDEEPLRQFVGLQQEVLKNMLATSKRLSSQGKMKKKKPNSPDSKDSTEPVSEETRLLREKLDAIRSMEKQLDGSTDAK